MNILEQFKIHLLSKKNKPSKFTVKNYISDARRFIRWSEEYSNSAFIPKKISIETIKLYKMSLLKDKASTSSIERYLSSLRSFFYFLKFNKVIINNPFDQEIDTKELPIDRLMLNEFRLYLLSDNLSKLTTKNYLMDIKQFLSWFEKVTPSKPIASQNTEIINNIDQFVINEYKNRLLLVVHLSPTSINRKLSSIRKYLSWLGKKTVKISQIPNLQTEKTTRHKIKTNLSIFKEIQGQNIQKINENENIEKSLGYLTILDFLLTLPITKLISKAEHFIWLLSGGNVFKPFQVDIHAGIDENKKTIPLLSIFNISKNIKKHDIQNIPKSTYAPLSISINGLPKHKKIFHHLKHTRPKWYKIYHSYPITTYLHVGILIIFTTLFGSALYGSFYPDLSKQKPVFASASIPPPKTIRFQGIISDEKNNPITSVTPLRFALYNNQSASGSALLWQEVQDIRPNQEGKFSAIIGRNNQLLSSIFSENPNLYLGMTVGTDNELEPRQQLATLSLSNNSEKLQGLIPITKNGAGTNNVVLALDSAGNLTIGGKANPIFQASGGKFTISGKTLVLNSTAGSDGNIEISPNGIGVIDLQKPLQNTTNNNNITSAQGAVEIDDLFAVLATSSGQSAFTINQNSTGPIISASASGTAKFTLENNGTGIFAGNLVINGNNLTSANTSFDLLNTNTINLNIAGSASSISIGGPSGATKINNTLIANGGITISADRSLIISGNVASNLIPFTSGTYDLGSATKHWNNGYIDNIYTSPTATVSGFWQRNTTGDIFTSSSSGSPSFTIAQNGNIGIADNKPENTLKIAGSLCVKNTTGPCAGNTSGTIYAANTIVQNADVAENYVSADSLEPGDVVMPEENNNNPSVIKTVKAYQSQTIGIVSTRPGITLNSDALTDSAHPYIIPIALSGRVPVKVSSENGIIQPGDFLTSSSLPGVAMKASKSGTVIGKALESYTNPYPNQTGKIIVFINLSFFDPSTSTGYTEKYNLEDNLGTSSSLIQALTKNIITNIQVGFIQAEKTATDSLQVTSDNITIGGQTLQEYIAAIIQESIDQFIKEELLSIKLNLIADSQELKANKLLSPLASTSASPTPLPLTPNPVASTSGQLASDNNVSASLSAAYITNVTNIFNASGSASENASNSAEQGAGLYPASLIASSPANFNSPTATTSALQNTSITNHQPVPIISGLPIIENVTPPAQPDNLELLQLINNNQQLTNDYANLSSLSGQLAYTPSLKSDRAQFSKGMMVLGPSTLSDVAIAGNLNVGGNLILANNTINTLGSDLELQPLRQGNLSIMGNLVAIDTNGNLKVSGNATFAKDVAVKGKLTASLIAPIPNQDLILELNNGTMEQSNNQQSKLIIQNSSGSGILAVNQVGDIIASGSGIFARVAANGFNIIRGAQADTSLVQTIASSSAGTAIITAYETERTIISPYVKTESLVYLSAASDTQGLSPYIARQTGESFTIAIPYTINKDIKINWWIIN